jgi:hypothetical protein
VKYASSIALAGALTVVAVASARAEPPWPLVSPPIILRLEGTFHQTADAARTEGFAVLSVGLSGREGVQRWFAVDDARTVGPDTPLDGKDVLADLAPLWPNLVITGPTAVVESAARVPDGARIRMEALVRRGSRAFYLRRLEPAPRAAAQGRTTILPWLWREPSAASAAGSSSSGQLRYTTGGMRPSR